MTFDRGEMSNSLKNYFHKNILQISTTVKRNECRILPALKEWILTIKIFWHNTVMKIFIWYSLSTSYNHSQIHYQSHYQIDITITKFNVKILTSIIKYDKVEIYFCKWSFSALLYIFVCTSRGVCVWGVWSTWRNLVHSKHPSSKTRTWMRNLRKTFEVHRSFYNLFLFWISLFASAISQLEFDIYTT